MCIKNKKAFTIIELIVVIAVIGILVLLAMPKFLGYVEKAQLTNIQNDVKIAENVIGARLVHDDKLPDNWEVMSNENLTNLAQENKLYDTKGLVQEEIEDGKYVRMPLKSFNTKLKGNFYANQGGKVYYESTKTGIINNPIVPKPGEKDDLIKDKEDAEKLNPDDYEDFTKVEDAIKEADKIIEDESSTQKEIDDAKKGLEDAIGGLVNKPDPNLAFEWVPALYGYEAVNETKLGYYKYVGESTKVEIPHEIKGNPMTSYLGMFKDNKHVELEVISTNPNVTSMREMFDGNQAQVLNLKNLDTSNVTDMYKMFYNSNAVNLDLSSFDTKNVTSMRAMFEKSNATNVILSSFDTINVTSMESMFQGSHITNLDLRNFNTSKVDTMNAMFQGSNATNIDLSSFDTRNVRSMYQMFMNSQILSLDLSTFDIKNVSNSNLGYMFSGIKVTKGYAKSDIEANRFNSNYTNKPSALSFVVK